MIKISVVIVNWNTADFLSRCLASLRYSRQDIQVYVVDNDSSDHSVSVIRKKYPWVKLLVNKENLGFAKANNQVLKKIKTKYVFILNPDTILLRKTIDILLWFMEKNSEVAACGPILLNPDKTIQKKGYYHKFPSLIQTILFYTVIFQESIKSKFLVKNFWEDEFKGYPQEVDQIPGACIFARTYLLKKVNFFDEAYLLWFEDVDLCFKLKKVGRLMLVPDAKLIHFSGAAFEKWTDDSAKQARFYKSLFLFFDKNSNFLTSFLVKLIIVLNFTYLIFTRVIKQVLTPTNDRKIFIYNKVKTLWKLV